MKNEKNIKNEKAQSGVKTEGLLGTSMSIQPQKTQSSQKIF
jgi:hypothetical protein